MNRTYMLVLQVFMLWTWTRPQSMICISRARYVIMIGFLLVCFIPYTSQSHKRKKNLSPLFKQQSCSSSSILSNTIDSVSLGYPNTEKRVENTTRSGVFLTKFEIPFSRL